MKGRVLDYSVQNNSGAISGEDGQRYNFTGDQWKDSGLPSRGINVDFAVEDGNVKDVYVAVDTKVPIESSQKKDKMAAGLLAIFLGGLGIHKFYLGFTGPGLVYLLINTVGLAITWALLFIPNMIVGAIALIEGIVYLTKSDEEFHQTYVVEKKQWF